MEAQGPEIYFIIVIGALLALLLVGFIVSILFLYQRRQHRQEKEMERLKDQYDREALRSQLEIQEVTFKQISQELHDNIGQVLSVTKLSLAILPIEKTHDAYEPLQAARKMLNDAIFDLANLNKSLHTDRITQIGLVEAIRFELEGLKKTGLLEVQYEVLGDERRLDDQKSIFLFRMFQEVLNNILKHSKATKIIVTVIYSEDNNFVLEIEDNGVGFNPNEKRESVSSSSGVGLKSMFNRANLIGAEITIQSQPGQGTTVTVDMPLPQDSK